MKLSNFEKKVTFCGKKYICCLGFSLLSIFPRVFIAWRMKWSHKSSFNQSKPHQLALRSSVLSNQANVSKHKFDQTWRIVYTFLDIFHLFYTFPRCKRLTSLRVYSCETCFIFWQSGTEFLCLANLTFRFVVTNRIVPAVIGNFFSTALE